MKKVVSGLLVLSALSGAAAMGEVDLPEIVSAFEYGISLDYYTHYIWRGQHLNESSFQPGVTISYEGMTAGFWGSLDLTDETGHAGQFTEVDWYFDYTAAVPGLEGVDFSVGIVYYNFATTTAADTTEFYWGLSFDLPLSPSFTVYHDVDEVEGTYVTAGIGHSFGTIMELSEEMEVGLDVGASVGWGNSGYNSSYWGVSDGAFNDLNLSVAFPTTVMGWDLTPSLNWTMVVDNKLRDVNSSGAGYDDDNNYFYLGVSLSKSF